MCGVGEGLHHVLVHVSEGVAHGLDVCQECVCECVRPAVDDATKAETHQIGRVS